MSKKVALRSGIFGGKHSWHALRKAITKAGFLLTDDITQADIVLCHSAGCFNVPKLRANQRLILVDPPYWPGRKVMERRRDYARRSRNFRAYEYTLYSWAIHRLWGTYYGITELKHTLQIIRSVQTYDLEQAIREHKNITLVRNQDDAWLTSDFEGLKQLNPQLKTITLPGDHDDIIYNPEPYLKLLSS